MDTENEIMILGVINGWIITVLSVSIAGMIIGVAEIPLLIMIGTSAGVLVGIFPIVMLIFALLNFKIVRRE